MKIATFLSAAAMVASVRADSVADGTTAVVDSTGTITTESLMKEDVPASLLNASATVASEEEEEEVDADRNFCAKMVEGEYDVWDLEGPGTDFGVAQVLLREQVEGTGVFDEDAAQQKLKETEAYYNDIVLKEPEYEEIRDYCLNNYQLCTIWAVVGECEDNPDFMFAECGPSCKACDKIELVDVDEDGNEIDDDEEEEYEEWQEGPGDDFGTGQETDPEMADEGAPAFTEQDVLNKIEESKKYMEIVNTDDKYADYRELCM